MRIVLASLALLVAITTWSGDALAAASLTVHASPASGWIPSLSDNKHRFNASLQGDYQDATTTKHFKIKVTKGGNVVGEYPALGAYQTNGTTASYIKDPAFTWGAHKVEATVAVYRKSDNSLLTTLTKSLDYNVPKPYGWFTAVTKNNAPGINVSTKLGSAEDAIENQTLGNIVRDAGTKVRGDNKACQECHGPGKVRTQWDAATMTKEDFCNSRVSTFKASGSKPSVLKDLFDVWKTRGCPD